MDSRRSPIQDLTIEMLLDWGWEIVRGVLDDQGRWRARLITPDGLHIVEVLPCGFLYELVEDDTATIPITLHTALVMMGKPDQPFRGRESYG